MTTNVIPFRVFYDVDEDASQVIVNAVRAKPLPAATVVIGSNITIEAR